MIGKIFSKLFGSTQDSAPAAPKDTFEQRGIRFWAWIAARTEAIAAAADQGMSAENALTEALDDLDPMISAEFFIPSDGSRGLQITARGETTRKILVRYLVANAPKISGWTFATARPAWKIVDGAMSCTTASGVELLLRDFTVALRSDPESQKLAIGVNHPSFTKLTTDEQDAAGHFFVDGLLGDNMLDAYIGAVDMLTTDMPTDRMPLADLRGHLESVVRESGADPDVPADELIVNYKLEPGINPEENPRADIESGWTMNGELVHTWLAKERYDLLENTGAAFAFLSFPNLEIEDEDQRHALGMELNEALRAQQAGNVIGAAHGVEYDYFDLILYDEARAIEILRGAVLEVEKLPLVRMHYFAPLRRNDMFRLK